MAGTKSFMTSLLALLDDDKVMKDVPSMPYSRTEQVNVENYLILIEKILDIKGDQDQKSLTSLLAETHVPFTSTVNELCCQIGCEARHTNDASQTMASLLGKLSSFSWDVKAVLTLSAFSVYYAEIRYLAENEKSDYKLGLAAVLRGPRAVKFPSGALKDLIRVTLEFTKCTVEFASYFKKLRASTTSIDITANFYQIICGVIGCSVPFTWMISASNEFTEQDLSPFLNCVVKIYESFKKQVEDFKQKNEEHLLYTEIKDLYKFRIDIVKFMALVFGAVNRGSEMTPAKVEELQNKNLMLLISNLTLSNADIAILSSIYQEKSFQSSNSEIVWVPVADVKGDEEFQKRRSQMPWYSCNSVVGNAAAKFIRKHWQFKQRTKLFVWNEKWEVVNPDAMPMIRLWASKALPFTRKRSDELWEEYRNEWLKLVAIDAVFQSIKQCFERKEIIFLFGSAEASDTVGQIENILRAQPYPSFNIKFFNINTIPNKEQFISRLENCICWKMQGKKETPDSRALKLIELHNSYKKQRGLAILARGPSVIVNTSLPDLLKVLSEHRSWITEKTNPQNFDIHFLEYYQNVIVSPLCYKFSIPNMVGDIPKGIKCPTDNCHRDMETVVTFKCCHGEH